MNLRNLILKGFDYDREKGVLIRKSNNKIFGSLDDGRRYGMFQGERYYMSHLIWLIETGSLPNKRLKNINGDASDTRFANLKEQSIQSREKMLATKQRYKSTRRKELAEKQKLQMFIIYPVIISMVE